MAQHLLQSFSVRTLKSMRLQNFSCTICGRQKTNSNWFLITENQWEDRLNVWTYDVTKVSGTGIHALCGPKHVRELVIHWMATGCLDYPFAYSRLHDDEAVLTAQPQGRDPEYMLRSPLCEIAVDRDGITRVLREDPLALNPILDEMMIVLENEIDERLEEEFDGETFPAQTVD